MGERKRPTIAELEAILDNPDPNLKIEILPNGEVRAVTSAEMLENHSCSTDPRVIELVDAAKDVLDVFNGPASSHYRWIVRLRTAIERMGEG